MIINLIFDQNPPASFKSAITSAALILDKAITDPITVTIKVGYGVFPTDHSSIPSQAAQAEPNFALVSAASFTNVVNALSAGAAPGALIRVHSGQPERHRRLRRLRNGHQSELAGRRRAA